MKQRSSSKIDQLC